MSGITQAQFSMQCSFMARALSLWAGDLLTLEEDLTKRVKPEPMARFLAEMRGRLDRIEEWSKEAAALQSPTSPIGEATK